MRRILLIAPVLAALVLLGMTPGPATAAGSCYGDYCSNKNPYSTTNTRGTLCATNARAIGHTGPVYGDSRYLLQLMWSDTCKVNFAIWTGPAAPTQLRTEQDTGYKVSGAFYIGGSKWASPMIYSPMRKCRAFGYLAVAGVGPNSYTAWL